MFWNSRKTRILKKSRIFCIKRQKLEDTFGVNMLAIANGRPETLNLKGILKNYLDFQYENNTRKYQVLLEKEQEKKENQGRSDHSLRLHRSDYRDPARFERT